MKLRDPTLETTGVAIGAGKVQIPPISQALLSRSETFGSTSAKNTRHPWRRSDHGHQVCMNGPYSNGFPSEVNQTLPPDQQERRLNSSDFSYYRSPCHPVKRSALLEMSSDFRTVPTQDQRHQHQQQQQTFSTDCFQQLGLGDVLDSSVLQNEYSGSVLSAGSLPNPLSQNLNQPPITSRSTFEQMDPLLVNSVTSKSTDVCGSNASTAVTAPSANFSGTALHQYGNQPLQSPTVNQSNQQESLCQTSASCSTAAPPPFSPSVGQFAAGTSVIVSTSSASCDYSPLSSPATDRHHQRHQNHQHHHQNHQPHHHHPHHPQLPQNNNSQHAVQHNSSSSPHQQQLAICHQPVQSPAQQYPYVVEDPSRDFVSPMMEPTATTAAGLDLGQPFDTTRPLLQSAVMVNLAPGVYYGDALPDDASNLSGPGYTVLQQVPYDSASYQNDQQSPSAAYSMLGPGQSRSSSSSLNGMDGVVLVESLHCGPSGTAGSGGEWRASVGEFQPNAGACNYTGEMSLQEYHEEQAVFIDQTGYDATYRQRKKRPYLLSMASQGTGHSFQSNLRSPALLNPGDGSANSPPPYTPPPILPPSRAGSGLYWNLLTESGLAGSYSSSAASQCHPLQDQQDYCSGLPPETDVKPHPNIGAQYQAEVPDAPNNDPLAFSTHRADLLWNPQYLEHIDQRELDLYLEFSCCASSPAGGRSKEYALCLLHMNYGNIKNAMLQLMQPLPNLPNGHPLQDFTYMESLKWTPREIQTLQNALARYNKDFRLVAQEVGSRTVRQCVQFYYYWKKVCTREYMQLRSYRLQRVSQQLQPAVQLFSPTTNNCQQLQPVSVQPLLNEAVLQPMMTAENNAAVMIPARGNMPAPSPSQNLHYQHNMMDYRAGYEIADPPHQKYRPPHIPHVRLQLAHTGARSPTSDLRPHQVPVASPASSQGDSTEDFPCKLCGKVFHKIKSRNAHMKSHRPADAESKRKGSLGRSHSLGRGRGARLLAAHRTPPEVSMCLDPTLIPPSPNYIIPNV